jgi:hypothetical protein
MMRDLRRAMDAAAHLSGKRLKRMYQHAVDAGAARECAHECARREEAARARGGRTPLGDPADSADVLEGYDGPHRALTLLTLAAVRLPYVARELARVDRPDYADDPLRGFALAAARDCASSTLGITQLALQAHAQAVGYDASAWVGHALDRARATLLAPDPTAHTAALDLMEPIRQASRAFTLAAGALANQDGLRVADELATGLGQTLVLFAIMDEALAG